MSFTGADGEGPQAVAAPGNCFLCTLFGASLCGCCNYGAFDAPDLSLRRVFLIVSYVVDALRCRSSCSGTPLSLTAMPQSPPPHTRARTTGKYREHNSIEGTPINDFLATCCLKAGFCQVLNDYELKHGGSFGMMGAWTKNDAAGAPASTEMEM